MSSSRVYNAFLIFLALVTGAMASGCSVELLSDVHQKTTSIEDEEDGFTSDDDIRTADPAIDFTIVPVSVTASTSAGFTFSFSPGDASALCSQDGSAYASCVSPVSLTGLSGGLHAFSVRVVDARGEVLAERSHAWTIDLTPPSAPSVTLHSGTLTRFSASTITVSSCSDIAEIFVNQGVQPAAGDFGWQACSTSAGAITHAITGTGSQTIKVWSKDSVGNVSVAYAALAVVLDTTAPAVTLGSLTGGSLYAGGATHNLSWTVSEAVGLATNPISIDYSLDSGATWTNVENGIANSSPYSFTIPSSNSADARVRVRIVDQAGNEGSSASSSDFSIDADQPSASITSPTALKGGASATIALSASDATSALASLSLQYAGDGTNFGSAIVLATSATSYSWSVPSSDLSTAKLKLTAVDSAGNSRAVTTSAFVIDSTAPTISSFLVNGGANVASGTALPISISASDASPSSGGLQYQFSTSSAFTGASWMSAVPSTYTFSQTVGTSAHMLYARVQDSVGNVSASSNDGVTISMGQPPSVTLLLPDGTISYFSTGQAVDVQWKVTTPSGNAIPAGGVAFEYTLDNGLTSAPWPGGSGLDDASNGGCVLVTTATGCVSLSLPAGLVNAKFAIVLKVTDVASSTGAVMSMILNAPPTLSLFAGRRSSTLLGTQATSVSITYSGGIGRHPATGDLYISSGCQILKVQGSSGIISRWAGHPTTCTGGLGDGTLANARFQVTGGNIRIDSGGNIYWTTTTGVLKFDSATSTIAQYIGAVNAPTSAASGTHRLSFTGIPTGIDFGYDKRVYFSMATTCFLNGFAFSNCTQVYRVENDGSVTHIAGATGTNPPAASVGSDSRLSAVRGFAVIPGATSAAQDRVFTVNATPVLVHDVWEVAPDATFKTLVKSGIYATSTAPSIRAYVGSRSRLLISNNANNGCAVTQLDPDNGANYTTGLAASDCTNYYTDAADDGSGGFFYTTDRARVVWHYNAANSNSRYAGVLPDSGDGGLAVEAELRAPASMLFSGTDAYIMDHGNIKWRKVAADGTISTHWLYAAGYYHNVGSGDDRAFYSIARNLGNYCARNLVTLSCVYFSSHLTTDPFIATTSTSSTPASVSVVGAAGEHVDLGSPMAATDGADTYFWFRENNGSNAYRSHIKKIDSTGAMTTVAGNTGLSYGANWSLAIAAGNALLSSNAGYPGGSGSAANNGGNLFRAANGILFVRDSTSILYSANLADTTPTWVRQTTGTMSSFAIDRHSSPTNIYYIVGTKLYRQAYVAAGSGTGTEIADFTSVLTTPVILSIVPGAASHSLYISDGNSVYKYTNATAIP